MTETPDLLVVGAGPTGCVIAQQAAMKRGWCSIVVDRRPHIGGLCHDGEHSSGVFVHAYGPHYFRTNDEGLIDHLSQFTEWIPGNYVVKAKIGDRLYPFPINLTTLELFFECKLDPRSAEELLDRMREKIDAPKNAEQWVCSRVGKELYNAFYRGYTEKQWGLPASELDKSVCGRIPVRLDRNDRYVDQKYQMMPRRGFTRMFENMLEHKLIDLRLNTEFKNVKTLIQPRIATVYSGTIDEYFDYKLGQLPWRSLRFEFELFRQEYKQPCVQINYPNDHAYTRSVEFKHVTGQQHEHTVVCYEYPLAQGDPYYPVPCDASKQLYAGYYELARQERRNKAVYISGRLGNYCYINSDEAIAQSLALFDEIERDALKAGKISN